MLQERAYWDRWTNPDFLDPWADAMDKLLDEYMEGQGWEPYGWDIEDVPEDVFERLSAQAEGMVLEEYAGTVWSTDRPDEKIEDAIDEVVSKRPREPQTSLDLLRMHPHFEGWCDRTLALLLGDQDPGEMSEADFTAAIEEAERIVDATMWGRA